MNDFATDERGEYAKQQRLDDALGIERPEAAIECPDCGRLVWYDADNIDALELACTIHDELCEAHHEQIVIDGHHVEIVQKGAR